MRYMQEVLNYITDNKDINKVSLFSIAEELKMPFSTVYSLYLHEKGLRDGSLIIIKPADKVKPDESTVSLEMLRNGWYKGNNNEPELVASLSLIYEIFESHKLSNKY